MGYIRLGNKNKVYHFIGELIIEEEYAWFVNQEGRFRINFEAAVGWYIEYRAKKNPGFDTSIDRSRASNSFREALLLRCYRDDGAKEYKECRKFSENNKVIEREFQMPSKVFHSLFGSSEELPDDQVICSGPPVNYQTLFWSLIPWFKLFSPLWIVISLPINISRQQQLRNLYNLCC